MGKQKEGKGRYVENRKRIRKEKYVEESIGGKGREEEKRWWRERERCGRTRKGEMRKRKEGCNRYHTQRGN